ncbi:MAG: hypothetical protein EBT78_06815 [Betaproteobacteria bacterium]|jgi:signal transduction histidine kinase|nr:hypothetical protein [Betaproteobacteria bacterium]NBT67455.1 hypothetical protein [Betaproteobacteria bacterium]NBY06789.1 hypothetical protein [Betaproteobacteria bacterium]
MVSHDMRTPLNGIIGFQNLARDEPNLRSEMQSFLDDAHHASNHLLTVINNLLDTSQIKLGKLALQLKVAS